MKAKKGFTLVEILIVVVILGILAAIVIPQFSKASENAQASSVAADLQTLQSQVQLYKVQHGGTLPGMSSGSFVENTFISDLTTVSTYNGNSYGPYMKKIPTNAVAQKSTVEAGTKADAGDSSHGWVFDTSLGTMYADNDPNL